ncbi:MAG TPA: DNA methyltransferase [Gemmatimonadaceae bacterium]|nr:DNA methyltransferase [Gemmatimonadaceae bacterium]
MAIDTAALLKLAERWEGVRAAERANFQPYLIELCEALGVERPGPAGSGYQFELPVKVITRDGVEVSNFLDCHRTNHFAIEAKDEEPGRSTELLLRKAFGQLRHYVSHAPGGLPPYLIVMDVARTAIVWDRWNGSYGDWQAGRRIDLTQLANREEDARFLEAIWTDPESLNPRSRAQAVTKEVAGYLANLARSLEAEGYEQERVARFTMRCVFTMFAEDIGLLADEPFRQILERCSDDPAAFQEQALALWQAMDEGKRFDWKKLMRFNGHFFRDAEALPLTKQALTVMRLAAEADWQDVEPAIFGTLLTRALDPGERHRLGAEFTPREFVERVVTPTVEEPIRERWKTVQAAVLQLSEGGKKREAERRLREFHEWMKSLRFLDPACGSGNFLYVTMHVVKRIELEVLRELDAVTGKHELLFEEVHPRQFYGLEIKQWAREIAELVLWIGYHQFWRAHHTHRPQEPILQDTGTIECRDAVLGWSDRKRDVSRDEPDLTPRLPHPVTGQRIPDPDARRPYFVHEDACIAPWPQADFIVGNPPYIGGTSMREALGSGYVDALRHVYANDLPEGADFVMYWWFRSAAEVAAGRTIRAGLITTNSISQKRNRAVVETAEAAGARVVWAIADHPWVDDEDGASVRVALTVISSGPGPARLVTVDDDARIIGDAQAERLNSDLSITVDIPAATRIPLLANRGLSSNGFNLRGAGFIVDNEEALSMLAADSKMAAVLRPYRNGRDLTGRPRNAYLIDFNTRSKEEASEFPALFNILHDRVKPERAVKKEAQARDLWWQLWRTRGELRQALTGLSRYIVTVETSKHRFFEFLDAAVAPDHSLVVVASDDAFHLGVLSSTVHVRWALAAGSRLGVGNDPRYNKSVCLDPFPFPEPSDVLRKRISKTAERIDKDRKHALSRDKRVTMTGIYNVIDKLRQGVALEAQERVVHEISACGVLMELHEELDVLVAEAYNWSWPLNETTILDRLVTLHDERVREENAGTVRWLRPAYQSNRFASELPSSELELDQATPKAAKKAKKPPFPGDVIGQIGAIKRVLSAQTLGAQEITSHFSGAKADLVRRHLETLMLMGEIHQNPDGRFQGLA